MKETFLSTKTTSPAPVRNVMGLNELLKTDGIAPTPYRMMTMQRPSDLRDVFEQFSTILPRGCALDIACGKGRNALFLAQRGFEVTAIDVSPVALEIAKEASGTDLTLCVVEAEGSGNN